MKVVAHNKYALYNYELIEKYEAGMILNGWEVRSIKEGKISLKESYITFKNGKLYLVASHVSAWPGVQLTTLDLNRDRELILHKNELIKIHTELSNKGNTAIVLDLGIVHNRIKANIAIAKGKKQYDKRTKLKEIDQKRDIERDIKHFNMIK
jgi:SsrA-binding protein